MNERVPDSAGLPLRAMVMVLLFLGVIFLLVGFQAMSSGNDAGDESSASLTVTTTSAKPAAPKPDVRVYSVANDEAAAGRVGDRLREAGWNVTEATTTTTQAEIPTTTVYFGAAAGEQGAAEEEPVGGRRRGTVDDHAVGRVDLAQVLHGVDELRHDRPLLRDARRWGKHGPHLAAMETGRRDESLDAPGPRRHPHFGLLAPRRSDA